MSLRNCDSPSVKRSRRRKGSDKFANPQRGNPASVAGHAARIRAGDEVRVCRYCHERRWYSKAELAEGAEMCLDCITHGPPSRATMLDQDGLCARQRTKKH